MAFSNTVSETIFNTDKVLTSAIRRCRIPAAQMTAEHVDIANNELFLLLSALANQGVPLWCIYKAVVGLYEGTGTVTLPKGIVDVLNANFRTVNEVTGTDTVSTTIHLTQFDELTTISTVGVFWITDSVPVSLQRSVDGVTWTEIQTEPSTAGPNEWSWWDLGSSVECYYFRVVATSGSIFFDRVVFGHNPTEITLARLNRDDYASLPNKVFPSSRVIQYWFDRQTPYPVMHLWPIPNLAATVSQLVLLCHRHIMDVGSLTQEIEVPQRWYDAIVAGLAKRLAREIIEVDPKIIPMLDTDAAEALAIAQAEERDNSPIRWLPDISPYTR